jgi:IclR family acetate operon transcriptional repressor
VLRPPRASGMSAAAAVAALSTPAPAYRMTMAELAAFVPVLTEAAAELAVVLPTA